MVHRHHQEAGEQGQDLSPVNDNFDPKAAVNKDSGLVWHYRRPVRSKPKPASDGREYVFGRTLSTVAVHDGLVYAAELDGFLHCLDAKTGKKYWEHDLRRRRLGSPYYVDGKVFIGTDNGDLLVFKAGRSRQRAEEDRHAAVDARCRPWPPTACCTSTTASKLFAIVTAK